MKLAVIPARGGSKRIPGKNIRDFRGKPILAYSIEAARASGCFDRVVVSTDDDEIAAVAEDYGAEVPFRRPKELSDDVTPTVPVIRHAIEVLEGDGQRTDFVCCLYATAPFLRADDLRAGLRLLVGNPGTEFAFSAARYTFPVFRALQMNEAGEASMIWPEHELTRSQDLPEAYHDAGQFYWGTREGFLTRDRIFSSSSRLVVLPAERVQDIDTPEDWVRAERLHELIES